MFREGVKKVSQLRYRLLECSIGLAEAGKVGRGAEVPLILRAGARTTAAPVSKFSASYIEPGLPELKARYRDLSGSRAAEQLRNKGRIPAIIFSLPGNKSRLIHVDRVELMRKINEHGASGFLSRPLMLTMVTKKSPPLYFRVLPRLIHQRPWSADTYIENVTFMHCPRDRSLKVPVPVKVIGRDVAPGCKKGGFPLMLRRTLDLMCEADKIPPFIEMDVSQLDLKDKIFAEEVKLPKGTDWINLKPNTLICKMATQRGG